MLLADKKTCKKLENRLDEFKIFGTTLYYLLEEGRTNINDLESIFFSKDDEKSNFIYGKIMKHIKPNDLKQSYSKYVIDYPNTDEKNLNIIYTKKIIDIILDNSRENIDKDYINTYEYLLTNITNK